MGLRPVFKQGRESARMSDNATGVPVHFVDERQSWDVVPLHLPVDSNRLTLQR
jgi:hypothetical protein